MNVCAATPRRVADLFRPAFLKAALLTAALMTLFSEASLATELPADSLYQSQTQWTTSRNEPLQLASLAGTPQVVAFVYSHCISMCPVIVADLQRIEQKLPALQRDQVAFTLITLDPDRDTPETLAAFLAKHSLDSTRWRFLRGSADDTRELALLFNVRYRREGDEIAHSNTISVLDRSGRLVHQRVGAGGLDAVVAALEKQLPR